MVGLFKAKPLRYGWRVSTFRREPGRPGKDDPPAPSRRVDVKIPLELLEQLERIAEAEGKSRHLAIREAIAEWVEKRLTMPESGTRVADASSKKH